MRRAVCGEVALRIMSVNQRHCSAVPSGTVGHIAFRHPDASTVVVHQFVPARHLDDQVPHHQAVPVVLDVADPGGHAHQRMAAAAGGVRQPHAVETGGEVDGLTELAHATEA